MIRNYKNYKIYGIMMQQLKNIYCISFFLIKMKSYKVYGIVIRNLYKRIQTIYKKYNFLIQISYRDEEYSGD